MAAASGEYTGLDELDLARMPLLTELAWGSDLLGAGTRFAALMGIGDQVAIRLLRWIQRKITAARVGGFCYPATADPETRANTACCHHQFARRRATTPPAARSASSASVPHR